MGARLNVYFDRHFAWLKYFTYYFVPAPARTISSTFCRQIKVTFFRCRNTQTNKNGSGTVVATHILSALLCRRKKLLHFGFHIHLQGQYFIPFPFLHCEKLALILLLKFR
jgi:hypothetical protein